MRLFRLLFLYVLSLIGFFCYENAFSSYYGVIAHEPIPVNQNGNLRTRFIYIPSQQWNELQEAIKAEWLQANPGYERAFLKVFGSKKREMGEHYTDFAEAFNYPVIPGYINAEGYTEKIGEINNYTFYGEAHDVVQASLLRVTPYVMTQNVMLIENSTDIKDAMKQNMEHETVTPQILHQFYIVEPIGGGGGAGGSLYRVSIVVGI